MDNKHTIKVNGDISLRKIALPDAPHMFRTIDTQREYLGEWLPFVAGTLSVRDSEAFIKSTLKVPDSFNEPVFAIYFQDEFAGTIGFKDTDNVNRKTEIGYWVGQQFQGKGIVTQSVVALCRHAFSKLDMNRIQIKCAVGNTKSSNIPKRLGFTFEGIERAGERQANGGYFDIEVYSILKNEFL